MTTERERIEEDLRKLRALIARLLEQAVRARIGALEFAEAMRLGEL